MEPREYLTITEVRQRMKNTKYKELPLCTIEFYEEFPSIISPMEFALHVKGEWDDLESWSWRGMKIRIIDE